MKKRIISFILAVMMVITTIGTMIVGAADINYYSDVFNNKEEKLATMKPVVKSENGLYELYYDDYSGEMAIKNLKTGNITLSNPYDASQKKLTDAEKGRLLSQVYLNFTTISTNSLATKYSYLDGALLGQNQYTPTKTGLKVHYILGEKIRDFLCPLKISVEDMNKLLSQIEDEQIKADILSSYSKYDISEFTIQGMIDQAIATYPICETVPIYVIVPSIVETRKKELEDYFKKYTDYTYEKLYADYEKVRDEKDTFYNKEDVTEKPYFEFDVTYDLTNEGLLATLDASSIKYDAKLYYINTISILPHFDSATRDDKGYMFMPDGSGTLYRFEDIKAKNSKATVTMSMYGTDYAYYQVSEKNTEQYTMPIFGLVNSSKEYNNGYFAIIEKGDALATLSAVFTEYYNSAYASFKIVPSDVYDLADAFSSGTTKSNAITIVGNNHYKGKCQVRYVLLSDEAYGIDGLYDASYMGMAKYYRDYLNKNGTLNKLTKDDIDEKYVKLFLEVFGSIEVDDTFLTFPIRTNKALTTFNDVKNIRNELYGYGVGNVSFILKGFANGGISSTYPTDISWQSDVGGKDGLAELLKDAKEKGYVIAPELDFSYSYKSKTFSAYSNSDHAVKTLDNRYTTKRVYYAATQTFERTGGVAVSSGAFEYLYSKFYSDVEEYELTTLAVRTLGSDLNSDFNKDKFIDRETAKNNVVNLFKTLKGNNQKKGFNLVVDIGNSYAIPYASAVLGASLDSSRIAYASEAVPFMGIVYHASVEFAGNALNMEGDSKYMFLKALENGASLYYTIAKQNIEYLKFDEDFNKYYSINYDHLRDTIINTYDEYNKLMKDKQDLYIVKHEFMNADEGYNVIRDDDGKAISNSFVVLVVYEDGTGFILNYNDYSVTVEFEGKTYKIDGLGYARYKSTK